jgi:hypothetical protein
MEFYVWVNTKTNKNITVERPIADRDNPPTEQELKDNNIFNDDGIWERTISCSAIIRNEEWSPKR